MFKKRILANSRFSYDMTLPDERYRAVIQTRRFLLDLCNKEHTPRVPKIIRDTARSMLRHYPSDYDMQQAANWCPEVFQEKMEDLHRFVLQGEQQRGAAWDPEVNQPHPSKD